MQDESIEQISKSHTPRSTFQETRGKLRLVIPSKSSENFEITTVECTLTSKMFVLQRTQAEGEAIKSNSKDAAADVVHIPLRKAVVRRCELSNGTDSISLGFVIVDAQGMEHIFADCYDTEDASINWLERIKTRISELAAVRVDRLSLLHASTPMAKGSSLLYECNGEVITGLLATVTSAYLILSSGRLVVLSIQTDQSSGNVVVTNTMICNLSGTDQNIDGQNIRSRILHLASDTQDEEQYLCIAINSDILLCTAVSLLTSFFTNNFHLLPC